MYYAIEALVKDPSGQSLYVTDNFPKVTATIKQGSGYRDDQLWLALLNVTAGDSAMVLKNKATGYLIAVQAGTRDALLLPDSVENETKLGDPSAVLQPAGGTSAGFITVRGRQDQNNSMNIGGDSYPSGSTIIFYGGWRDSNSQWKFVPVAV